MLLDYRIPIASWVEKLVRGIQSAWAAGFDGFADIVRFVINGLLGGLQAVPPLVLLAVLAALVTWATSGSQC